MESVKRLTDVGVRSGKPRLTGLTRVAILLAALIGLMIALGYPLWQNQSVQAAACQSNGTGGGVWSSAASWQGCGGVAPTAADSVAILSGDTITLDADPTVLTIDVQNGGILTNNGVAHTLTLAGTSGTLFTLGASGTFTPSTFISVVMNPDAAVTLTSGTITFYNLTLSPTITLARTYTFGSGALTINGDFMIRNSQFGIIAKSRQTGDII